MRIIFLLSLLLILACTKEPAPILFGEDGCSYCRMQISDQRFGGELLTDKGKPYKFDSIECMAAYILKEKEGSGNIQSLWTIDFNEPEKLIDARQSWYLKSGSLKSTMGLTLRGYKNQSGAQGAQNLHKGEVIRWQEVRDVVQKEWLN